MKYTKGKWTIKNIPSHGLEIYAEVNMGTDEHGGVLQPIYNVDIKPHLKVGEDGKAFLMIAYESWRQFPSINFQEMQEANAQLIAAAPDGLEAGVDAYIALLRTSGIFRIRIQKELCQLRDFIAKATGQDPEEVQNEYEAQALAKAEGE